MSRFASAKNRLRRFRDYWQLPPAARRAHRLDRSGILGADPGPDAAIDAALGWLCKAQSSSTSQDGGVARHFSLIHGWGDSYPETTGYIVPTMLRLAERRGSAELERRGRRMLDWLLDIQLGNGAFQGGTVGDRPVVPVAFNTGQILLGLAAGSAAFGKPYTRAMHGAATWLARVQDDDGCWRQHQSPFARPGDKAYDTHAAWGLLEAARVSENAGYASHALRNIRWATSRQHDNGWFDDCCLTDPARPLTHTIGYALRGIIEGYGYSREADLLEAARRAADGILSAQAADGRLPGRLDSDWRPAVSWDCLTGSVQIAHCWLQLYRHTGSRPYLDGACAANRFVRRTLSIDGPGEVRGAVRGSYPIYGGYGQYQYLNWAAKFFLDSSLLEQQVAESLS